MQELRLELCAHFADFIEKNGSRVGLFKLSDLIIKRTRKGTALVAKQFGFEQLMRQGRAIDFDEWPVLASAMAMDEVRHDFLTDAGFSKDQNRNIRAGNPANDARHAQHFRIRRQKVAAVVGVGRAAL